MTSAKAISRAKWSHKLNSEEELEHEYSDLLQELVNAVERQDGTMLEYCACELKRMFRESRP